MLNYEFPPIGGGAGKAHHSLLKEFADNDDLKIDVLASAPKPGFPVEKFAQNITIYKVGLHKKNLHYWHKAEIIEWLIKGWFLYRKLIKINNYDLVHAFFGFPSGWLCYRSSKHLPYIISLRGSDVPGINPRLFFDYKILSPAFRRIWQNASVVVACSEGLRQRALNFFPKVDIEVIPNGVDLCKFKPPSDKPTPQHKALRLLTVGRLSSSKRLELLIAAVKIVHEQYPDIKLTIAGGGKRKSLLQQKIKQLGLGKQIVLLGNVPDEQMPKIYQRNDIFVSATQQEGMSNAMLEALASGLPVITTYCEGIDELIIDNGIVIKGADPQDIASAIKQLIQDQNKYNSMACASRKRAAKFTWPSVADQYIKYYQKIST